IEGKVRTLGDWVVELRSQVEDADLAQRVFIEAKGERVLATGLIGPQEMKSWQQVAKQFVADTRNLPPLESLVKVAEDLPVVGSSEMGHTLSAGANSAEFPLDDLRITVLGIALGQHKPSYAWLGDGTKVAEGDVIKANYVVETIEFDRIIVSNHAKQRVYYVEEVNGGKK
ncbi:MAG: hypothetical protein V2J55_08380, partial [Candidatus Competibacteraceae bacterium]|nr:hypothetical protein [Candidatus Competibacteraceae bacterium]